MIYFENMKILVIFLIGLIDIVSAQFSMSTSRSGPSGALTVTSTTGPGSLATAIASAAGGKVLSFSQSKEGEGVVFCFASEGANNVCVDTSGKKYNLVYKAPDGQQYCAQVNNANTRFFGCGSKDEWKFVYSNKGLIIYEVTSNRCLNVDTGNNVKTRDFKDCKPSNLSNVWNFQDGGKLCSQGKCLAPQQQGASNAVVKDPNNAPVIDVKQATS